MNRKSKIIFKEWLFVIFAWLFLTYLFNLLPIWGVSDLYKESVITDYIKSGYPHLEIFIQSVIIGLLFSLINHKVDNSKVIKRSFGAVILIKSFLYIFAIIAAAGATYILYVITGIFTHTDWMESWQMVSPALIIITFIYFFVSVLVINFILQVNRKFGPGNLIKMITGKYHKPKNEVKIFMFLDLTDSTGIAEKLGNNKYSQLLQQCFHDLTEIIITYRASVYQYVGDEVVLFWNEKDGLANYNCLKTFFVFEKKLRLRKDFYLKKHGVYPKFKASLDYGEVTVSEIGDIKREIAYHGDVLNTAARLLDLCKVYKKKLLISHYLEEKLPERLTEFKKEFVDEIEPRGKHSKVKIYSIEYEAKNRTKS